MTADTVAGSRKSVAQLKVRDPPVDALGVIPPPPPQRSTVGESPRPGTTAVLPPPPPPRWNANVPPAPTAGARPEQRSTSERRNAIRGGAVGLAMIAALGGIGYVLQTRSDDDPVVPKFAPVGSGTLPVAGPVPALDPPEPRTANAPAASIVSPDEPLAAAPTSVALPKPSACRAQIGGADFDLSTLDGARQAATAMGIDGALIDDALWNLGPSPILSSAGSPWNVNPAAARSLSFSLSFRTLVATPEVLDEMVDAVTLFMQQRKDPAWTERVVRSAESAGDFARLSYSLSNGLSAVEFTVGRDIVPGQTLVIVVMNKLSVQATPPPAASAEFLPYVEASPDVVLSEFQDSIQSSNTTRDNYTYLTYRVGGAGIDAVAALVRDGQHWSRFGTLLAPVTDLNASFLDAQGHQININWTPPNASSDPLGTLRITRQTPLTDCPVP
jgi:hypothetical protein